MEENNKKVIVKGSVIIIIAILGLNVYRTETMKLEIARLTTKVEQLSVQLDSLGNDEATVVTYPESNGFNKKEFTTISKSVASLESKVATLQETVDRLSRSQAQSVETSKSLSSSTTSTKTSSKSGRVTVSAKVKVENRYVQGTTFVPRITSGPAGIVVINVVVTRTGTVGSVTVDASSTITDEEILDACKEAALRTDFAYNPEAPNKSIGTITYTFTAK